MKIIPVILAVILCLVSVQAGYSMIIVGLVKTGGDTGAPSPVVVHNGLVSGALSYVDRVATWDTIPTHLIGADYVKTENDDKNGGATGEQYSVTLAHEAVLHVFVDQRLGSPNSSNKLTWLLDNSVVTGGFIKSGEIVLQDFPPFNPPTNDFLFDVWSVRVSAGTYNLGEQTGASMYGIAATPIPEPGTIMLLGVGLLGLGLVARRR